MFAWRAWGTPDPAHAAAGVRFDHTPSGKIRAPTGKIRVCAYHVDFDERPTCFVDVDDRTLAAQAAQAVLHRTFAWNVDFATAYDADGAIVGSNCPWGVVPF